ncbi:hypothetical protein CHUAL_012093 [Chamberlinius hualienensis]
MLTLRLLLSVSLVLQCVCDNSSLCNEVKLKPSDYEIKANSTVKMPDLDEQFKKNTWKQYSMDLDICSQPKTIEQQSYATE